MFPFTRFGDGRKKKEKLKNPEEKRNWRENSPIVRLLSSQHEFHVDAANLAACSSLVCRLHSSHPLEVLDLRGYDASSVHVLADFVDSQKLRTAVSIFTLGELNQVARKLEMADLAQQLEKYVRNLYPTSTSALVQSLLVLAVSELSPSTEEELLSAAASKLLHLPDSFHFYRIPLHLFASVVGRCDIKVDHELQVADVALAWLAGQDQSQQRELASAVFSRVRVSFFSNIQKALIKERARALQMKSEVLHAIHVALLGEHASRVCMLQKHVKLRFPRCGEAPTRQNNAFTDMPLSLPPRVYIAPQDINNNTTSSAQMSRTGKSDSLKEKKTKK